MDGKDLPTDVEALKRLLLQSQTQLQQRDQQLAQQVQQLAQRDVQVTEMSSTISEQQQKLAQKDQQIAELLQALRGKSRERIDPDQLLMFELGELEALIEEQAEESAKSSRARRRKSGRRVIPDGLPEEVIEYELDEDERRCPVDGVVMERIRWEESKQLDYIPAKLKVIVHRRAVYACTTKHDEAKLVTAPKPPQPIEKGLAAPGLLAQVVVGKFGDHLPGYRLEDIFSRHQIEIRRSTIYDWLAAVADLCQPLYDLMKQQVLASRVIHTDDTQVKLIDTSIGGTRLARFWAYVGDRGHPYTVYDFTADRSRIGPTKFLKDFSGYLQADAYGGYDGIYVSDAGKNSPSSNPSDPTARGIVEVACWAHCRRYWYKAREQDPTRAHHVLGVITQLYEIERACCDQSSEFRQTQRAGHAAPLLADLGTWLDEQTLLPKSLIGKAATYTRNQWIALNRYTEEGELSIDNNLAERTVKPIALGRKAWLFIGSVCAGHRAATLMSLIASCKANHVEPWAYLRDIFKRLPHKPTAEALTNLLPDRWLAAHPDHRWNIAIQRKQERQAKN